MLSIKLAEYKHFEEHFSISRRIATAKLEAHCFFRPNSEQKFLYYSLKIFKRLKKVRKYKPPTLDLDLYAASLYYADA